MAVDFTDFTPSNSFSSDYYLVGYDQPSSGGEKKWKYSTLFNSVSSDIQKCSYVSKAYVSFDATKNSSGIIDSSNTNRYILKSNNVSSVLKTNQGFYTVTFSTPMSNSYYLVIGNSSYISNFTYILGNDGSSTNTTSNCYVVSIKQTVGPTDISNNSLVVF